jgi:hypothetical protein
MLVTLTMRERDRAWIWNPKDFYLSFL